MDGFSTLKAILAVTEETLSKGMFLPFKSYSTISLTKISKYNLYFFF